MAQLALPLKRSGQSVFGQCYQVLGIEFACTCTWAEASAKEQHVCGQQYQPLWLEVSSTKSQGLHVKQMPKDTFS